MDIRAHRHYFYVDPTTAKIHRVIATPDDDYNPEGPDPWNMTERFHFEIVLQKSGDFFTYSLGGPVLGPKDLPHITESRQEAVQLAQSVALALLLEKLNTIYETVPRA